MSSTDKCNKCTFGYIKLNRKPKHKVEQIVKGTYIELCTFHLVAYKLRRFKWALNQISNFKLEKLSRWWVR